MKKLFLLSTATLFHWAIQAQVVTTVPPYFTLEDSVTITFNATQGNGVLNGTTPVYVHTGVINSESAHGGDWQNQVSTWAENTASTLMTSLGGNQHRIGLRPTNYYGAGDWQGVRALAMVFRNSAGTQVGQNADGSDIFIPVFTTTTSLDAVIMNPIVKGRVVSVNDPVTFNVRSNNPGSLIRLYRDGVLLNQGIGDNLSTNIATPASGKFYLSYTCEAGGVTISDTTYYVVRPAVTVQDPPAGTEPGITIVNSTTVRLCLWAPFKQFAYAVGDFSNWELDPAYMMNRSLDGERYWITLNNVTPGQEYRFEYYVDGMYRVADPYSYKVLEEFSDGAINPNIYPDLIPYPEGLTSGDVSVFQTEMTPYQWVSGTFQRPAKEDLVIYELLIRDFSFRKSFSAVIDSLDYLKDLGVNAIKLMPIMEFEGNDSWGYNPTFFMAVDKKYGPANELKRLIDECHQKGIAVILDIVPNHSFGRNPYVQLYWDEGMQRPSANSPYHNPVATHPFSVGYDFNHESQYVRQMFKRIFRYWINEFKIDGYRVDLSKGLTQNNTGSDVGAWSAFDQSRINIIFDYANDIWALDPGFHLILEHLGDNSEETVLANGNIMLWGKATDQFNQATMGYQNNSDWGWQTSYQAKGWNSPRLVSYMESHDEERLMFKNVNFGNNSQAGYNARDTAIAVSRMEAAGAMHFLIPGPKMLWQFGELGYDISINWPSGMEISRTAPKPVRWTYFWEEPRQRLYKVWSAIMKLKHMQPVYSVTTYGLDLWGFGKRMWLSHPDMNTSVTANFGVTAFDMTPDFQNTGTWYNYMTGEPLQVNQTNMTLNYQPGQYYIYTTQPLPIPDFSYTAEPVTPGSISESDVFSTNVYPNPTTGNTFIEFDPKGERVTGVEIFDLMGRPVKRFDQTYTIGLNRLSWNGADQNGSPLPSGQYVVSISTDVRRVCRMVLLSR